MKLVLGTVGHMLERYVPLRALCLLAILIDQADELFKVNQCASFVVRCRLFRFLSSASSKQAAFGKAIPDIMILAGGFSGFMQVRQENPCKVNQLQL